MIGEISLGGVFIPSLLLFAGAAFLVTGLLTGLLSLLGFYRMVTYRPVVDLALFFVVLGAIVQLTLSWGLRF